MRSASNPGLHEILIKKHLGYLKCFPKNNQGSLSLCGITLCISFHCKNWLDSSGISDFWGYSISGDSSLSPSLESRFVSNDSSSVSSDGTGPNPPAPSRKMKLPSSCIPLRQLHIPHHGQNSFKIDCGSSSVLADKKSRRGTIMAVTVSCSTTLRRTSTCVHVDTCLYLPYRSS